MVQNSETPSLNKAIKLRAKPDVNRAFGYLFVICFILIAVSCSPERKLAHRFLKEHKPGAVMLIAPDLIYKNSYKIPELKNFGSLTQAQKDSVAFYTSTVLQYTYDSIYIKRFISGLTRGFTYFGFEVSYNGNADKFLNKGNLSLILNYVQIQLEEYLDSISDDTSYDYFSQSYGSLFVTAMNINNWVEVTELNSVKSEPKLLFNGQTIYDDFEGTFTYFPTTGRYDYYYDIDSLNTQKLYNAAETLGFRHAQWIFDYVVNDYISKNLPAGYNNPKLLTYDFRNKYFKKLRWKPFEEIID